jgi:hypothetical protein
LEIGLDIHMEARKVFTQNVLGKKWVKNDIFARQFYPK